MKLATCYTIFITVISVDCGLIKDIFGTVKEDINIVVDNTVHVIGKGTHKITEGFGVFVHRKEGTKFPEHESVISIPVNNISSTEKTDNGISRDYKEENVPTTSAAKKTTINNDNNSLEFHNDYTTESNSNKNASQPEEASKKNEKTMKSTTTNVSITESEHWAHGEERKNESVNELGVRESNVNNITKQLAPKLDGTSENQNKGREYNLVSDQMFFKDNKPQIDNTIAENRNACSEGLVRAANGDCLKPVEFNLKHSTNLYSLFQADGCPTGYARAEDHSCQKIIG